jgi:hypothetical protein
VWKLRGIAAEMDQVERWMKWAIAGVERMDQIAIQKGKEVVAVVEIGCLRWRERVIVAGFVDFPVIILVWEWPFIY